MRQGGDEERERPKEGDPGAELVNISWRLRGEARPRLFVAVSDAEFISWPKFTATFYLTAHVINDAIRHNERRSN